MIKNKKVPIELLKTQILNISLRKININRSKLNVQESKIKGKILIDDDTIEHTNASIDKFLIIGSKFCNIFVHQY